MPARGLRASLSPFSFCANHHHLQPTPQHPLPRPHPHLLSSPHTQWLSRTTFAEDIRVRGRSLAPRRTIASSLLTRIVRSPSHLRTHFPLFHHCRRYLDMARRASMSPLVRPVCRLLPLTAVSPSLRIPITTSTTTRRLPSGTGPASSFSPLGGPSSCEYLLGVCWRGQRRQPPRVLGERLSQPSRLTPVLHSCLQPARRPTSSSSRSPQARSSRPSPRISPGSPSRCVVLPLWPHPVLG